MLVLHPNTKAVLTMWLFFLAAITCGHPGNPANGLTQGNQFNLNDVAKFVCNTGYHLEGTSKSQCLANGQWSNTLPICRSKWSLLSLLVPSLCPQLTSYTHFCKTLRQFGILEISGPPRFGIRKGACLPAHQTEIIEYSF